MNNNVTAAAAAASTVAALRSIDGYEATLFVLGTHSATVRSNGVEVAFDSTAAEFLMVEGFDSYGDSIGESRLCNALEGAAIFARNLVGDWR